MTAPSPASKEALAALQIVTAINRLTLKALETPNRNALIFSYA